MAFSTTDQHESGMSASRAKQRSLCGMKEICVYAGKSESTVLKLIRDKGFPAAKVGGVWESDENLVDAWRVSHIEARCANPDEKP